MEPDIKETKSFGTTSILTGNIHSSDCYFPTLFLSETKIVRNFLRVM